MTGIVTDGSGKPVAGATVFSSADGPRPAATTTDAAGWFTLGGLYEGPAFVSVKADGFRLRSVSAEPGGPSRCLGRPTRRPRRRSSPNRTSARLDFPTAC